MHSFSGMVQLLNGICEEITDICFSGPPLSSKFDACVSLLEGLIH